MSWNLTKKLKETHLGFSKSSTPSTKDKDKAKDKSGATTPSDVNSIADARASEDLTQAPVIKPAKPGILVLTLYEARGLSLPEEYQDALSAGHSTGAHSAGDALSGSTRTGASTRNASAFSGSLDRPQTSSGSGFKGIPTNHGRVSGKYMPYALVDFDKNQVFINSVDGNPENPVWAGSNTQYKFDVSRVGELTVQLFMRNPAAAAGTGRTQDIFLGAVRASASDVSNVDDIFKNEPAQDSVPDDFVLSKTMQDQFVNFSYNRPVAGLDDAGGSIKDPSFLEASETRGRR
ncbi:hypothetical protein N5P37_009668 [Trichoderma harzianum]|nr:hypothetical protein N5P37_009668 [Trichoderma harzianum]